MKKDLIYLVLVIILLLRAGPAIAQQDTAAFQGTKHRVGLMTGFGGQKIDQSISYDYRVVFFQLQYYWAFVRKKAWGVDLLIQPQYNLSRFRYSNNNPAETNGFEFGVNAGILVRKNIFNDFLSMYALVSSGPHYVSGVPQRQAAGFIFSDNFLGGLQIQLRKNTYLDVRSGFRHISNAGLTSPNYGVNDFIHGVGFLINL